MRGFLTRDERAVIAFLATATAVGAIVLGLRGVDPALVPDLVSSAGTGVVISDELIDRTGRTERAEQVTGPIDVNEATEEELTGLPGIGPAKAAAIVRYRERHGRFASLDALLDVSGVGPATLDRLRPVATLGSVEPPTEGQVREGR